MEEKKTWERKNQYTCSSFDREQNAIQTIDERTPGFEYAGGFTHCDGDVLLRCKKCGSLLRRSMITVRKRTVSCEHCQDEKRRQKKQQEEDARNERREKATQAKRNKEAELFINTRLVECSECGTIFSTRRESQVCCSVECTKKRNNRKSSHRKDARITIDKRIDKDITAKALYYRDNGVCWICGKQCDLHDYTIKNGVIICGNNYPGIDHVIPISQGGEDAWNNVKLAHRRCNTFRFWHNDAPPGA